VQIRVIAEIDIRDLPERDVRQSADSVTPFQNARPLARLDVLRGALIGGLRCVPVPLAVDLEVVVPVMIATRRRWAMQRIGVPFRNVAGSFRLQRFRRLIDSFEPPNR
jgi:hypothetical protein